MEDWHAKRTHNAECIMKAASQNPLFRVPQVPSSVTHAWYKAYVFVNGDATLRNRIMNEIVATGVPCFSGSCSEIYLEKAFGAVSDRLPVARELGDSSLMFLVHPTLSDQEISKTVDVIKSIH
jgi:dTDP-4-amino-4,6-dideoxygalactose transaminase